MKLIHYQVMAVLLVIWASLRLLVPVLVRAHEVLGGMAQ